MSCFLFYFWNVFQMLIFMFLLSTESNIVILGDNNLICISDTGKVKFIKRLDYTPTALCSFVIGWYWGE